MKKLYPAIVLLCLALSANAQRRLIKATSSGNWTTANTWTTTGSPSTPTDNDSIVIASGVEVKINSGNGGIAITLQDIILDIFGTLTFDEPNPARINELDIRSTSTNIATPLVRIAPDGKIQRGVIGSNGRGEINVIKGTDQQLKYSTKPSVTPIAGQNVGPTISGPANAQNTVNQQPMYFSTGSSAALPVTFALFRAAVNQNNVQLNWTIGQQVNAKNFLVERSSNGTGWEQVGSLVVSAISNQYQYTDATNNDVNYYRLKIVDLDGKIAYSDILVVRLKGLLANVSLAPNPTTNNVNISIGHNVSQQSFIINVFNHGGQLVARRTISSGTSVLSFDVSNYKAGIYTLDIVFAGGVRESHKLSVVK